MKQWREVVSDLTVLDDGDPEKTRTLGGRLTPAAAKKLRHSSVYRIYHLGVEEVRHRIQEDRERGVARGLAGRSILAVRASLDGGLVRESQKLSKLIVLLVIFILMCTASVQGQKVALPDGSSVSKSLAGEKLQAITVNHEGKFFLNTQQVSLADLETRLGSAKAAFPGLHVVVKGDATTNYQGIMDVLNVAGQLGITEVGFATKSASK